MEEKTYGLKKRMKVFAWIMGIICIPLVVTIPFAVLMIMLATRARLIIREDKMIATWVRTREYAWSDVTQVEWGAGAKGLIGALMGKPLMTYDAGGKRRTWGIMVNSYENTDEIVEIIEGKIETGS